MSFWKKKPVVIEAFLWTSDENQTEDPDWAIEAMRNGTVSIVSEIGIPDLTMIIMTLEGTMYAKPGDYIIKGIKGEIYPCRADIFEATYEAVDA